MGGFCRFWWYCGACGIAVAGWEKEEGTAKQDEGWKDGWAKVDGGKAGGRAGAGVWAWWPRLGRCRAAPPAADTLGKGRLCACAGTEGKGNEAWPPTREDLEQWSPTPSWLWLARG